MASVSNELVSTEPFSPDSAASPDLDNVTSTDISNVLSVPSKTMVEVVIPQTSLINAANQAKPMVYSKQDPELEQDNQGNVIEDNYDLGFSDVLFITLNWILIHVLAQTYYAIDGRIVAEQVIAEHLSNGTIAGIVSKSIGLRIVTALEQLALTDTVKASSDEEIDTEKQLEEHIISRINNRQIFLQLLASGIRDAGNAVPTELSTRITNATQIALNSMTDTDQPWPRKVYIGKQSEWLHPEIKQLNQEYNTLFTTIPPPYYDMVDSDTLRTRFIVERANPNALPRGDEDLEYSIGDHDVEQSPDIRNDEEHSDYSYHSVHSDHSDDEEQIDSKSDNGSQKAACFVALSSNDLDDKVLNTDVDLEKIWMHAFRLEIVETYLSMAPKELNNIVAYDIRSTSLIDRIKSRVDKQFNELVKLANIIMNGQDISVLRTQVDIELDKMQSQPSAIITLLEKLNTAFNWSENETRVVQAIQKIAAQLNPQLYMSSPLPSPAPFPNISRSPSPSSLSLSFKRDRLLTNIQEIADVVLVEKMESIIRSHYYRKEHFTQSTNNIIEDLHSNELGRRLRINIDRTIKRLSEAGTIERDLSSSEMSNLVTLITHQSMKKAIVNRLLGAAMKNIKQNPLLKSFCNEVDRLRHFSYRNYNASLNSGTKTNKQLILNPNFAQQRLQQKKEEEDRRIQKIQKIQYIQEQLEQQIKIKEQEQLDQQMKQKEQEQQIRDKQRLKEQEQQLQQELLQRRTSSNYANTTTIQSNSYKVESDLIMAQLQAVQHKQVTNQITQSIQPTIPPPSMDLTQFLNQTEVMHLTAILDRLPPHLRRRFLERWV
ncbi:hypothetical protein BDF19DRAFT_449663 [Syncephalis fuscata]|nr:hypothetical protein BDF19DRAFT_449663 [Syncephalis fuscata]